MKKLTLRWVEVGLHVKCSRFLRICCLLDHHDLCESLAAVTTKHLIALANVDSRLFSRTIAATRELERLDGFLLALVGLIVFIACQGELRWLHKRFNNFLTWLIITVVDNFDHITIAALRVKPLLTVFADLTLFVSTMLVHVQEVLLVFAAADRVVTCTL